LSFDYSHAFAYRFCGLFNGNLGGFDFQLGVVNFPITRPAISLCLFRLFLSASFTGYYYCLFHFILLSKAEPAKGVPNQNAKQNDAGQPNGKTG